MSILPFKTKPGLGEQTEIVTDELGNSIEVPKYGCVTWQEQELFSLYTLESSVRDDLPLDVYKTEVVLIYLRCRFQIGEQVSKAEILTLPGGTPVPQSLIDKLSTFFKNERERWNSNKETDSQETVKKN
ncbi:hypothetical protein COO91_02048 [Nostoc flagelliforme CCNUN1]|uniref:Uncharacterized protein n=1 Tax=Nostoc flagelliforme CCNUN1 TaxID=2038116 RepID=A0A2K8SL59_9NOSO|nr:hypothetical protein [Nostoc flagelliforme]AUB36147.1 hypothetical protein COO91_02048 [Nostoc flagelliforme CCNUN1]